MPYVISIIVQGEDRASVPLGHVHSALGNIMQFAAGGLLAQGINAIGGAIVGAGQQALAAVSNYERLGMSLEALLAREIKNASGIEKTIKVGQERIQLTKQEIAQLETLKQKLTDEGLARETLAARIQEQKERIRQLTLQYGENGLVVIKERAELAQMQNAYDKSGAAVAKYTGQIAALEAKNGKVVDTFKKVREGALSMSEALAQAGPKAAELIQWVEKLAILSPFKSEDIAASLQTAMNFKFSSDMAKRLTQDLVDMAAATGKTGDNMRLISYALGQINNSDKLLMQDLRQLINAGVDVEGVLNKMGFSLKDVGEKAIDSKKFIETFLQTVEDDFGGAAARQADSLSGLLSSLEEIRDIALRDIFTGAFMAAKPVLSEIVALITDPNFRAGLQSFGTSLGKGLTDGIAFVRTVAIPTLQMLFGMVQTQGVPIFRNLANAAGPILRTLLGQGIAFLQTVVMPLLLTFAAWIQTVLVPALMQFAAVAGPQLGAGLNQLATWLQQIFQWGMQLAQQMLPQLLAGFDTAQGTLGLITPVLAAIGVALAVILGPIFAIPAGLVLLATAWANNWGGIQEKTAAVWAVLQPIFAGLVGFITGQLIPGVTALAMWFGTNIPLAAQMLGAGLMTLQPFWDLLARGVNATISILTSLSSIWVNLNRLVTELGNYLGGVIAKFLGIDNSVTATSGRLQGFGAFLQTLGGIIMQFYEQQLKQLLQGFQWLVGLLETLAHWLGIVADYLANLTIPDAFQRHSPSPFEQMLMNANAHLREMRTLLPGSLGALGSFSGPQFAFAGAPGQGSGFARGVMNNNSRAVHFYGPVTIRAHDYADFKKQLFDGTMIEERFQSYKEP